MAHRIHAVIAATALITLAIPIMAKSRVSEAQAATAQSSESGTLWNDANRGALKGTLARRERHGLDHVTFLRANADQGSTASIEAAYNEAALDYARALAQGVVDPSSLREVYTITRPAANLEVTLEDALHRGALAEWLDELAPGDAEYLALSDAYLAENRSTAQQRPKITLSNNIRLGDSDPRVVDITKQLVNDGYLTKQTEAAASGKYSQAIADAVKALQRDYGIREDGIVGPDTLGVLTLRPGDRARAVAVGLERRRWLSRTPPATRIDVNTASAELRYFRDGKLINRRKVIVGEPDRETPGLGSSIYRLVANPTWTVPKSIRVSTSTVRAKNMRRINGYWVQPSGPNNALGLVKFDMRNNEAIYLHDTASPGLFDRSQRHLSHGCVRVEDALGFAAMLADQEGVGDAWAKAHGSGQYTFVDLPREIPVRLLYHNAFIAEDGNVAIRTDPYGWNDAVAKKLGFADAKIRRAKAEAIDVGP